MAATDPSFPSPADGAFDGPLAAMVVLLVAVAVAAVLWPTVRSLLRRPGSRTPTDEVASPGDPSPSPPDPVEPRRSRSQRTRDVADQLLRLQRDRDAGLLTDVEYDRRRKALLDESY